MGGNIISRTKTYCYLGILVDENLSWTDHISKLCRKLSQVAGVIFKIRHLLTRKALLLVYHSLVGSKLRYGLICWATAQKFLIDKVNVAHNKIITALTFSKRCSRLWPLYCQLKVLPLKILIHIEYGKTMFKYQKKLLPSVFNDYFKKPSHAHFTRFSFHDNLEVVRTTAAFERSMLRYIGPTTWNSIPSNIKESMSLKVFIKSYRIHLIGNFDSM